MLVLLAACTGTPQLDRLGAQPSALPVRAEISDVPFFPQEDLYCGPAALVLAWTGQAVTLADNVQQVYTPGRECTLRSDIIGAAWRNGRLAIPLHNLPDLLGEFAAGNPVIVFQNLGLAIFEQWHFAVVIGFDLEARNLILHSGRDARRRTSLATLERTWQRGDYWALAVLPPDRIPATACLEQVLAAAVSLERTGQLHNAAIAYRATAARWVNNDAALIGLANIQYAQFDLAAAEHSLREAVRRAPGSAAAWNNLAVVLGDRGDLTAAIAAAERAIGLDGGHTPTYRDTLADLPSGS